ncbi:winged helix-turn-helix domain-containing protein [Edaphobacter acidisoli]|nr:winged helix-turn-helix domain-containing protein [Edaphobacter acidisoli]
MRIRLAGQPFDLLAILLERPGEVVTREELRERLWGPEVFVDFEHGLNKAMQKLREALGDSAESPRYIETIQRTGYRFIAPVSSETGGDVAQKNGSARPGDGETALAVEDQDEVAQPSDEISSHRVWYRSWKAVACVAVLGLAATAVWISHLRSQSSGSIHAIAVLPLKNASGDPSQTYFVDGMTGELATMLVRDSTLRVSSTASAMQYKGSNQPLPEIAHALHADALVEGSIARTQEGVHLAVHLVRADTGRVIWTQSYERSTEATASLSDEVAREIASRLHSVAAQSVIVPAVSSAAHDAYLRGRYFWMVGRNDEAGKYFRQAVEIQPDYAAGWAGLSSYYTAGALGNGLDPEDALPRGKAAALKAVQLDDKLPLAHAALGAAIFFSDHDGDAALREVRRATELDPELSEEYHLQALILSALGRYDEALAVQKRSTAINPITHPAAMAEILLMSRQYDQALNDARIRLHDFPDARDLLSNLVEIYHWKGMDRESAEMVARLYGQSGKPNPAVMQVFAAKGHRGVVEWMLNELKQTAAKSQYVSPALLARYHAQLGERDETIALLERAADEDDPKLVFIQTDPSFDFIHEDAHYRALLQRIGLWSGK